MPSDTHIKDPIHILINAPPETIYNFLVDFRNHISLNHQIVDITQTTSGPIQEGTVFEAVEHAPCSIPN